jgi:mRNA interferase RelE/StbE
LAWRIEFTGEARKQLGKIGHAEAKRIRNYLRQRIEPLDDPRQLGKALKGHLTNLWRYRIGDFRLICEILDEVLVVLIVRIGHRREIYR